jgi:diaminohydroxyphosphoribosylaminopyrimidine deaminase / 5-amino-6-(5-phosphoribosylamino)uracil reductase
MPKHPDTKYMSLAISLAKRAEGMTSPNPLVGAVLVKEGRIIGKGYHKRAGLPHAEIEAIFDAENKGHVVKGSTLYVTLEPCCHRDKRTPRCVDSIVKKGISNVVVGTPDPNPKVSGNGIELLKQRGVNVRVGVVEEVCKIINETFFKYIRSGIPFVTLKLACTLDGKIATMTGDAKWIGSESQRNFAHRLRKKVDAILVGIETVLHDDPQLTVRLGKKATDQPIPIVLDTRLRIPIQSRLLKIHKSPLIITTNKADLEKKNNLEHMGSRVLIFDGDENGKIDLASLLKKLGELEITSVLIEGGSRVAASALSQRVVDKIVLFYTPKIIGAEGVNMVGDLNILRVKEALAIRGLKVKVFGEELMIEGYI